MKKEHVTFKCGKLKLEGIFYKGVEKGPAPAVVVCHPHPLYGGSMHNNVTYAIASALAAQGINALLFNFRGVGASEGSYGGGIEERKDVLAALDWLQDRPEEDRSGTALAGYSFGAGVVFPVGCSDDRVKAMALVSPYFEYPPEDLLKGCLKPKLLVGGSEDQVVPGETVEAYGKKSAGPVKVEIIKGPDHFWGGYESKMSLIVAGFLAGVLGKNQGM